MNIGLLQNRQTHIYIFLPNPHLGPPEARSPELSKATISSMLPPLVRKINQQSIRAIVHMNRAQWWRGQRLRFLRAADIA